MLRQDLTGRVWCAQFRRDRRELMPLFKLADDSEQEILSYLFRGEVFIASEAGRVVGEALIIEGAKQDFFELRSFAIDEARQRQGIGSMLLRAVVRYGRMQGAKTLRVSTAIADGQAVAFYLRNGFRASRIVRDAFTTERGYPSHILDSRIALNDAIELELELSSSSPNQRGP